MAELTTLEEKLAEVIGLAKAAQDGDRRRSRASSTTRSSPAKLQQDARGGRGDRAPLHRARGSARRQEDGDPREGPGDQERGRPR